MTTFAARRLARHAAPLALLASVLACGGGDGGGAAAPDTLPPADGTVVLPGVRWPDDKCSIVSPEDVEDELGHAVEVEDAPPFGCQYPAVDQEGLILVIEYFNNAFECELVESNSSSPEVIDGLGVRAVRGSGNIGEVLAVTVDEDRCFFVHTAGAGDVEEGLAELVLASL